MWFGIPPAETVNFDDPEAYHLYVGDERGAPGPILTWFESPAPGAASRGRGMIHTIQLGVASEAALDFWADRLAAEHAEVPAEHAIFDAIYFREPRGVLFEIATLSPGFAVDEDPERLGEELRVLNMHAHLRERVERTLTPVVSPRAARREKVGA